MVHPDSEMSSTSCRLCPVRCDQVVHPSGCLASGCNRLYSYEEDGRMYIGCLERVFAVDIDLETFREIDGSRGRFGGLRVMRDPLPICRTSVDPAMPHRLAEPCVNPGMGSPMAVPGIAGRALPLHGHDGPVDAVEQP